MNEMMERYWRYKDTLEKLAAMGAMLITIKLVGVSESVKQSCYKEIRVLRKKKAFDGTLIDYLCYISSHFILYEYEKEIKTTKSLAKKWKKKIITEDEKSFVFSLVCETNSHDATNMLRLFRSNPNLLVHLFRRLRMDLKEESFFGTLGKLWKDHFDIEKNIVYDIGELSDS